LRDIFLEEAREVVRNGLEAVSALLEDPADLSQQTTLRRAFHTLKGSSRMVGFTEFGEAAWAMEQMMNSWLAEQKPARPELLQLSDTALRGLGQWVEDIAGSTDGGWSAAPFRASADAMRLESKFVALELPQASPAVTVPELQFEPVATAEEPEAPSPDFVATQMFDFELPDVGTSKAAGADKSADLAMSLADIGDIDFGSLANVPPAAAPQPLDWAPTSLAPAADLPPPAVKPAAQDWAPTRMAGPADLPALDLPEADQNVWADTSTPDFEPEPAAAGDAGGLQDFDFQLEPASAPAAPADEQVKVIGTLRIGIPLYNVYLNEADEWSRRLVTELNEWALELHNPVPDSAIALAHSLAGSSATVGFVGLSEIARALEHAMQHVQLHGQGLPEHAQVFVAAADEIRHLLHQFAAGFLKSPEPGLVDALNAIHSTEFAQLDAHGHLPPDGAATAAEGIDVSEASDIDLGDLSFDFSTSEPAVAPVPGHVPAAAPSFELDLPAEPAAEPVTGLATLPGAAQIVADDSDEDIDAVDTIDPDLFPIFEEEATELMPQLGSALRQWSAQPDSAGPRLDVLRVLHTLKGSARLAGAMRLGEMAHRMESAIEQMGSEFIQTSQIDPMLTRFDRLQHVFDELCHGPSAAPAPSPVAEPDVAPQPVRQAAQLAEVAPESAIRQMPAAHPVVPSPAQARVTAPAHSAGARPAAGQTVRVRSQLLDRLVNQAGEVMITRSRLDQRLGQLHGSLDELTANLDRLRTHLRDVEVQAESQMQSRLAQAKDTAQGFDPLEFDRFTRVQELTRMMAESVNDVATVQRNLQQTLSGTEDDLIAQGRQARELQRDLLRTRMTEFEGISERLYGVVRQASKDAGKQVRLDITGGTMEIDRGVLERMAPAFEHMLRNSVAHGIETPQVRDAAGKPAVGTITIALSQEGNDVSVTFSDDGAGLNLARIREKAQAQGLIAPGQVLSDGDAANMIFMPGFSTAASVTELAGRGIGMDVVRSEVQALGGRIETATQAGVGTSFKLVLPLTTAVTQVIMLRMGELSIGVPANLVEIVRRLNATELDLAYHSGNIPYGGEVVPFFWAGALLQASARSHEHAGKTHPVVVLRSAGQRLAIHVDEVLGNQEVVVKNLGPQLSRLPGLAGMSVLASGAVVLIYNPVALATVYGDKAQELQQASGKPLATTRRPDEVAEQPVVSAASEVPLVLVVDDSITVRRVTQRLLRREGYRVALAADGLQALERLAEERPAVVLSDIEKPRMDGFDLARNIRNDAKLRDLPIIMITSRIAEKHREHARELGVDHYLGKPYSEDELLNIVKHYCTQPVQA
jgi:chemosensory pili system protein ChpA (sensor histidine kinase/response regulator)